MRADRLVSLVLLLRRRGRLTSPELARELEVSTRTVLRDVDALSVAGVPIYAERGRHGGFSLLPGFRTELTGLTHDEALALLATGSAGGDQVFGLGPALASALRKVLDALPESQRSTADGAAARFLVDPETDLLSRRADPEDVPAATVLAVRRAVLAGRRLRLRYAAADGEARWRTVDPIGLVTVRGRAYLLATRDGADRTYRLARILEAEVLTEPAQRAEQVDLADLWQRRGTAFRAGADQVTVTVRLHPRRRSELADTALALHAEPIDSAHPDGWALLRATFQDARHAVWALWMLADDAEALDPPWLRAALHERAALLAARYGSRAVGNEATWRSQGGDGFMPQ